MKKSIFILSLLLISTVSFGQSKKDTVTAKPPLSVKITDTVTVDLSKTKFIVINGRVYNTQAFVQYSPVFMTPADWNVLISVVDKRSYGEYPASSIFSLLSMIQQQLPQK